MNTINSITARIANLKEEEHKLNMLIADAPSGKLIVRKDIDGYRYSVKDKSDDGKAKETYIPRKEVYLAKTLALKAYAQQRLPELKKELRLREAELKYLLADSGTEQYLKAHPGIALLIQSSFHKLSDQLAQWKQLPYERNNEYPEDLIYPTIVPDLLVRSKAEADIISRFEHFGVPYHYEEALKIGSEIIHPDFTCKNLHTGQTIYWEHQGRRDDPKYNSKLSYREELYRRVGVIPWKNLLITTETKDQPLDILWVDIMIDYFLL